MVRANVASVLFVGGLALVLQGCAEISVQRMIDANDHNGLANYYAQQAQELRGTATRWQMRAEWYEMHPAPHGKVKPQQHAAHCRAIADSYKKAADEAEALAREHDAWRSHGLIP